MGLPPSSLPAALTSDERTFGSGKPSARHSPVTSAAFEGSDNLRADRGDNTVITFRDLNAMFTQPILTGREVLLDGYIIACCHGCDYRVITSQEVASVEIQRVTLDS